MIAFGPVPSRRLGKSLGINNLSGGKKCSYSCVYCQVGKTNNYSIKGEEFYAPETLYIEVEKHIKKLDKDHYPDYLTFVANGEPTLDINLGKHIRLLKKLKIPVAVITNASLLHYDWVYENLLEADWLSLKVDTASEKTWKQINKPANSLHFEEYHTNLFRLRSNFKSILNTESMLVDTYNDSTIELEKTAKLVSQLQPQKAYLSIPTRPPAVSGIKSASEEKLNEAYQIFTSLNLSTELLIGFEGKDSGFTGNAYDDILNTTSVHPLREDAIIEIIEKDKAERTLINSLIKQGLIRESIYNEHKYYIRRYFA
ncbi:MAG: radical SAM protein [Bacteroidales bacterium]|nr:radical SAM protein [Bacteroidales bacterium]